MSVIRQYADAGVVVYPREFRFLTDAEQVELSFREQQSIMFNSDWDADTVLQTQCGLLEEPPY